MSESVRSHIKSDIHERVAELRNRANQDIHTEMEEIKADRAAVKSLRCEEFRTFIDENKKVLLAQVAIAAAVSMIVHCIMHHIHKAAERKEHRHLFF